METEFNRTIFNVRRPSPKAELISFPMYMYRIKTKQFEYGMDFFQKSVLMLKSRPGIDNSTIAACLGLDEDLISEIQGVLAHSGYLTSDGIITEKGIEKKNNMDSLIIDNDKEEIGYVFQYIDRNEFYPYYIKEIGEAPNVTSNNEIIVGTKGDGKDKSIRPTSLDFIIKNRKNLPSPNERVIFDCISRTGKEGLNTEKLSVAQLSKCLSLGFLNKDAKPVIVEICTYIYLPQKEDDLYEPDWQILDPFGKGNNSNLKFYIASFKDTSFDQLLDDKFGNAETVDRRIYTEFNYSLSKQVEEMREKDFDIGFLGLDANLRQYITSAIKSIIILRHCSYNDNDAGDTFIISCQKILETLLLIDKERRNLIYELMYNEYSTPANGNRDEFYKKRRSFLKEITRNRIIKMTEPDRLIKLSKFIEPNRANSLKQYVYNLILTYKYDNKSPLFQLFNGQIDKIFDIADLRNEKGHGQLECDSTLSSTKKDIIESNYNFIVQIINKFISMAL